MTVRVVLVDDQPLVRSGLRVLIADTPDLDVVGEAGTGTEAVRVVGEVRPDVVVMDIRMPDMDGIEATRRITGGPGTARVLVLTTFDEDDHVYGALRAGASGFMVKDMALDDILTGIRVVAAGDALIAPSVTRRLIADFVDSRRPARRPGRPAVGITDREREVLTLIGRGRSNGRSPTSCTSVWPPPSRTSPGCSASSAPATGCSFVITAYELGLVAPSD